MSTHWYMGNLYRTRKEEKKDSCEGCEFYTQSEICHVNIWVGDNEKEVVCGVRPVIFEQTENPDEDFTWNEVRKGD